MKKIFRILLITAMVMCLGTMPALAGNTNYNAQNITNFTASKVFKVIPGTANTKATANADWFMKVTSISFTQSTSGTLGMAFAPMFKNGTSYGDAGANPIWAKTTFSSAKYASWIGSNGKAKVTYYLGSRLDTLLTDCIGNSTGYWNSN